MKVQQAMVLLMAGFTANLFTLSCSMIAAKTMTFLLSAKVKSVKKTPKIKVWLSNQTFNKNQVALLREAKVPSTMKMGREKTDQKNSFGLI